MAVRVELRIKNKLGSSSADSIALVNSGFETFKPQLLIPVSLAQSLGLWPQVLKEAYRKEYGTAAGSTKVYVVPEALEVCLIVDGECRNQTMADTVISLMEDEVPMSDKLAGKLGIAVYDFGGGIWRLREDSPDIMRRSKPAQYWAA